jgi:hypothetical protein
MANWEASCRISRVEQEDRFGCGVACLAMIAGITYAEARLTLLRYGLGSDQRRNGKKPFSTNFTELMLVLAEHGKDTTKKQWKGWDQFEGIGIIKVRCAPGAPQNSWHWVVAEQHSLFGVVIHDPDFPLPCFQRQQPEDVACHPFDNYEPHGCWISIVNRG